MRPIRYVARAGVLKEPTLFITLAAYSF